MAVRFAGLDRARERDRIAEQQQFLGDGRLASVWMGNDGEGTTSRYLRARTSAEGAVLSGHAGAGVGTSAVDETFKRSLEVSRRRRIIAADHAGPSIS